MEKRPAELSFGELARQYPDVDVIAEYRKAQAKLGGSAPTRAYFGRWLANVDRTQFLAGFKRQEFTPPTEKDFYALAQAWGYPNRSYAKYLWRKFDGEGWRMYGEPIRNENHLRTIMAETKWPLS